MTPNPKPKKSEWMQIVENDKSSSNVRKVDKRLTLGTLVSVGAIVIAGSLFANASDEPSAVADITSVASSVTSSPTSSAPTSSVPTSSAAVAVQAPEASKIQAPAIAQMPTGGDDEDDEHEGRRGRGGDHEDDDDDEDDEDEDHDEEDD